MKRDRIATALLVAASFLASSGLRADDTRATEDALATVERPHLRLRVDAARAGTTEVRALADRLEAAVLAMAPRVPVAPEALAANKPEVLVEADYAVQGRRLGKINPGVLSEDGRLHIVLDARDADLYVWGLARLLLRRSAVSEASVLADGAALWLAGQASAGWYGRAPERWMDDFAFAGVLPAGEELLAPSTPSPVIDVAVASAVVERLPGRTAAEKLKSPPPAAGLDVMLSEIAAAAEEAPERRLERRPPPAGFLHGLSFAMANGLDVGYHAPGVDDQLRRFKALGADSVSLMPFAYQPDPSRPELSFLNDRPSSETDVGVIHAARRAHAHGMSVLWKPHVWVRHDSWPGEIEMTSEEDWRAWWRSYRRYVVHHAVLAEWTRSELFCLGVELGRTVKREAEWRHLARSVRRIYTGALTYAGNWWGDYDQVAFWDELDFVGVDAYFPLAHEEGANRALLVAGARRTVEQLRASAERFGRPILLTEVGFAAREAAWVSPHEEGGTVSEEDQRLAYEVLLGELGRPDWLRGLYVWKVFSHAEAEARVARPDFRLLGRPAEEVVRRYFSSAAGVPAAE